MSPNRAARCDEVIDLRYAEPRTVGGVLREPQNSSRPLRRRQLHGRSSPTTTCWTGRAWKLAQDLEAGGRDHQHRSLRVAIADECRRFPRAFGATPRAFWGSSRDEDGEPSDRRGMPRSSRGRRAPPPRRRSMCSRPSRTFRPEQAATRCPNGRAQDRGVSSCIPGPRDFADDAKSSRRRSPDEQCATWLRVDRRST